MSTRRHREDVSGPRARERWLWLVVFAVPPGIGMTGFVAVALERGGLSVSAVAAGVATTAAVATLVYVTMLRDGDEASTA